MGFVVAVESVTGISGPGTAVIGQVPHDGVRSSAHRQGHSRHRWRDGAPVTVLRRDGRGPLGTLPLLAAPRRLHPRAYQVLVASHAGVEPAGLAVHGTMATVRLGDEQ